jgi:TolA-binding protein
LSPKAIQYRANSIIYFKGDQSEKIYILNSGKVSLNYLDIETGQDVHDLIKTGEFFGVKSALGRYQREENALVVSDSVVVSFTVPEFEQLVAKNTRIITKMLKVFSNQLRRIHKQVKNLLSSDDHVNPETGLFKIGEYYLKNKDYSQAIYAFGRYLVYYPSGKFANDATKNLELAEQYIAKYGQGKGPSAASEKKKAGHSQTSDELSSTAKKYYFALSLITKQNYQEALDEFKAIVEGSEDNEYVPKSWYEIGRCFFFLENYQKSISVFTNIIKQYPKHPDLNEVIFYIAESNRSLGETTKALGLYKKLVSMVPESDSLYRKVKKAIRELEK